MACPDRELLSAYRAGGALPPAVAADLAAHIAACDACRGGGSVTVDEASAVTAPDKAGAVARATPSAGDTVGRYVVLGQLGEGGMGAVCLAYDPKLDRKVALKFLRRGMARWEARLVREAQAMAHLPHPNIVPVHDVGEHQGLLFIAMEYVDGATVADWVKQEPRSVRQIIDVFIAAGRGIAAAHAAGLIHRDVKPNNLLIGRDGRVRVTDFGLVRATGARSRAEGSDGAASADGGDDAESPTSVRLGSSSYSETLTDAGAILGTPPYMAPEQLEEGGVVDERSDQFSFCVSLYRALYGELPFVADGGGRRKLREAPGRSKVPRQLRRILVRGLSQDPASRFSSMSALLEALEPDPAVARRRALGAAGVVLMLGAAVAGWRYDRLRRSRVCEGGDEQLAAAWSAPRKEALAAAFAATGMPWASRTLAKTVAALDGYGARWVAMRKEACLATRVRGDQSEELLDLRMQCLDDRKAELRSFVGELAGGDRELLVHGVAAAQALTPLDDCGDARVLKEPLHLPRDAARRAAIEALRARLATARGLLDAGRYPPALAAVDAVVAEARPLGFRPLDAEAAFERGKLLERTGDGKAATAALVDALLGAVEGHHDQLASEATTELVSASAATEPHFDEALAWSRQAEVWIRRSDGSQRLSATLELNLGVLYFHMGKYDLALEHDEKALALRERLSEREPAALAAALGELANVYEAKGQRERAVELQRRVVAMTEKELGPDHPDVGAALVNVAAAIGNQGKFGEALALYERALAIFERAYPPDHPFTATCLANLGEAKAGLGRLDDALADEERALAMRRRLFGDANPDVAVSLSAVGEVLDRRGDSRHALEKQEEALRIQEKLLGPRHPDLADTLVALGRAALHDQQPARAVVALRRALALDVTDPQVLKDARQTLAEALRGAHVRGVSGVTPRD